MTVSKDTLELHDILGNSYLWISQSAAQRLSFEDVQVRNHRPQGLERRFGRRGTFRRSLFRRQRWILPEYDWNVREFDWSHSYAAIPHRLRVLEHFDDLTYEEMLALEEHMGIVTRGFNDEQLARLPTTSVKGLRNEGKEEMKTCTICLDEFFDDESVRLFSCCHVFHTDCVDLWLKQNKSCPICKTEVAHPSGTESKNEEREDRSTGESCGSVDTKTETSTIDESRRELSASQR